MTKTAFIPKRGRPSSKQVKAIDEAILETARRIFLADGFDALAMDGLALELGISKGTLYSRHPSKEALLQAVIRDTVRNWSTVSAQGDHLLPEDLAARLRQHLRIIGRKIADPEVKSFYELWMSVRNRDPEIARIFHDVGFLRGVAVIAADLEAAGERDGRPPGNATGTATLLLSTLTGWYSQESDVREVAPAETDAVADRIVALFMLGREAW